jgi:predicted metal-dependent hydrolase
MPRVEPEEQDFDPDSFGAADAEAAFAEGARLFEDGAYHAAHEAFERCWLASEAADADFFKGLIQACICLHHFQRENLDGARKLYQGHRRLLGAFLPAHRGIDVARFLAEMQRALAPVLRARRDERVPFPGAPPRLVRA